MLIPPCGAQKLPSMLEPPLNAIRGILYSLQILAITETSAVDFGYATATGKVSILFGAHSENPCNFRSSSSVDMVSGEMVLRILSIACKVIPR